MEHALRGAAGRRAGRRPRHPRGGARTPLLLQGRAELAATRIDRAIEIAESLWLPEALSEALNTQGLLAGSAGRSEQALALIEHSLELALEHDLTRSALRAYNNLGDLLDRRDRYGEAIEILRPALALARKAGYRMNEWRLLGELGHYLRARANGPRRSSLAREVPEDRIPDRGRPWPIR